jgi:predicted peptidase
MKNFKIFLMLCFCAAANAQLSSITDKTTYPFWINMPEKSSENNKLPILFFLHGRSLSGTDLKRVKRYGVLKAIEKGRKIPAIIVAPQLASGGWNAQKLLEILDYVQSTYKTDKNRVYVCGMSLGGYGSLEFAGKFPNKIAAAVAICGGGVVSDACNLAKIPVWIQHGDADKAVNISESYKIFNAIKSCNKNANTTMTVIKGGTHGSAENLFHQDGIYDWMFSQTK